MKLPTLYPFLGFAGGIVLFRAGALPGFGHFPPRTLLLIAAALLLFACFGLIYTRWIVSAGLVAAAAWLCLGFAAAGLEQRTIPANLASTLIDSGSLDSSVALRWRGILREDPLELPWGLRYVVELDEVESANGITPVRGGLRVTLYRDGTRSEMPLVARAGDRIEFFTRAASIHNFGNPGSEDVRGDLAFQGLDLQGTLRSDELLTVLGHPRLTIGYRLARLRGNLLRSINILYPTLHPTLNASAYAGRYAVPSSDKSDEAALARAMLLGDRSFVDRDRAVEFQETGVYHVLVLAGLHIGALTVFFLWLGKVLRIPLFARVLLTVALLAAYVGIVEDRPPILRAALMAVTYLLAQLLYRRMELLNIAALSALVILAARPSSISNPGFILSYVAVGIIGGIAAPWIEQSSGPFLHGIAHLQDVTRDATHPPRVIQFRMELRALIAWAGARWPSRGSGFTTQLFTVPVRGGLLLWELLLISAFLQLGMLPSMAYYFHRVTLVGPIMNVPALLLTGLIVPLGFLTLTVTAAGHTLGQMLAVPLGLLLRMLDGSVHWMAVRHDSSYRIPGPPMWITGAFVICAIALSVAIRRRQRAFQWAALVALLAVSMVIGIYPFAPRLAANRLEVTLVDVGQGDSLFVSLPQAHTMLIDAGGILGTFHAGGMHNGLDTGEDVVSPYLWSRGIKRLDVVALTHAHEDHLGGMAAVLRNFRVGELWVGRDIPIPAYREILAIARERGVAVKHLKQGDTFTLGGVTGNILWPENTIEGKAANNDDSLVMRLTDGSQSFLLTGDIERPSERKILASEEPLEASFLKVGHHGGKTSTTAAFLSMVHPKYAAVSAGRDNPFGHPSPDVLERLDAAGVRVFRTDQDGAITASTDGKTVSLTSFTHSEIAHANASSSTLSSAR